MNGLERPTHRLFHNRYKTKLKLNERRQAKLTTNRNTITTYLYLTLYDFSPFTRLSPLYTVLEKCRQ